MSKAWVATDYEIDADEGNVLTIHAETRGQARSSAAGQWGIDFVDTFAKSFSLQRAPEFDDKPFDDYTLLKCGYYGWTECLTCQIRIYTGSHDGQEWPFSYADGVDPTLWDEDDPEYIEAHPYGLYVRCGVCHRRDYTIEQSRADMEVRIREMRGQYEAQRVQDFLRKPWIAPR